MEKKIKIKQTEHRKEILNIIDAASYFLKFDDINITEIIEIIEKEIKIIKEKNK